MNISFLHRRHYKVRSSLTTIAASVCIKIASSAEKASSIKILRAFKPLKLPLLLFCYPAVQIISRRHAKLFGKIPPEMRLGAITHQF